MNKWTALAVGMLGLVGCDSSMMGGGPIGGSTQPSNHILANDQPGTIDTNTYLDVPFQVPTSATVSYQIADRSSTSPDKFTTDVLPDSEVGYFMNKQPYHGFAPSAGTAPLTGQGVVPPGNYHFVALCQNIIERCQFSYTVDALF